MNNKTITKPDSLIANIEKQFDKEVYVAKYSKMIDKAEKNKICERLMNNLIIGVFKNPEEAKKAIHEDYKKTKLEYEPDFETIEEDYICIVKGGSHFYIDEWAIDKTNLFE